MIVPTSVIVPLFLVAFLMMIFQYYRINPDRRLLNAQFIFMASAIVLVLVYIMSFSLHTGFYSVVFLLLGLSWVVIALVLHRRLPPPRV